MKQEKINSYPHFGMRDKSYDNIIDPENGHDLYKPGNFAVHVIDCLRDSGKKDPTCCAGIAGWYFKEFEIAYKAIIDGMKRNGYVSILSALES